MEPLPKASKLYIGLEISNDTLRRTLSQLLAGWGFLPAIGKLINERCLLLLTDCRERADYWESKSQTQWTYQPIILGIGFAADGKIEPVTDRKTADDFRMTLYYWLGNQWKVQQYNQESLQ